MKSGQHLKYGLNVKFVNSRLQGCLSDRAQLYDTCSPLLSLNLGNIFYNRVDEGEDET